MGLIDLVGVGVFDGLGVGVEVIVGFGVAVGVTVGIGVGSGVIEGIISVLMFPVPRAASKLR